MDSWTDKQLALMNNGGNGKCNDYLKAKGIDPRTPIKQKYESDAAQLYKEILKARVEGRPEPTSIPKPAPKARSAPPSMNAATMGSSDANGMERMAGETDQQYIARQSRLRDEARARMQAKFGSSGGRMGGVGSSGMQGLGSNPNYNPGGSGLDDVMSGVTSVFSTGLSLVGGAANTISSSINSESARGSVANLGNTASSFWGSISSSVNTVATSITAPDGDDGLADLQREFHSNRPAQSKYGGFGSEPPSGAGGSGMSSNWGGDDGLAELQRQFHSNRPTQSKYGGFGSDSQPSSAPASRMGGMQATSTTVSVGEAPGLSGEDRNGVERLSGETDEQYVVRQTRLRDEAKARMAAKFGGGGMGSATSSSSPYRPAPVPASGGFGGVAPAPVSAGMSLTRNTVPAAPRSGGLTPAPRSGGLTPPRKNSADMSSDDFFSSFGT